MDTGRDRKRGTSPAFNESLLTWAILATGPSLKQTQIDYVRGKCNTVAVSDAYLLAPWANVLVSNDRRWWELHPDAFSFKGLKFCSYEMNKVGAFREHFCYGRNSGLMGMCVARAFGARRLILLGFDMHGTHFFGAHPKPLLNSTDSIFKAHIRQFDGFSGCEVLNCTPESRLTRFPMANLCGVL